MAKSLLCCHEFVGTHSRWILKSLLPDFYVTVINAEGIKQAFTLLIWLQIVYLDFCECKLNRKLTPAVSIVKCVMLVCTCVPTRNVTVA